MGRARHAIGLVLVAAAFLAAASLPCPKARVGRGVATDTVISAPCPCHCAEHTATSAASQLDPVLRSTAASIAPCGRTATPLETPAALPSAPPSLPDPVPISA